MISYKKLTWWRNLLLQKESKSPSSSVVSLLSRGRSFRADKLTITSLNVYDEGNLWMLLLRFCTALRAFLSVSVRVLLWRPMSG